MSVIRSHESPVFEVPGFSIHGLAAPSRGATELCTWRLRVAPGADSGTHSLDREEVFVLVSGTMVARIAGVAHEILQNEALVVPAHTEFSIGNDTDVPCEAIVCVPAGLTGKMGGVSIGTPPWAS